MNEIKGLLFIAVCIFMCFLQKKCDGYKEGWKTERETSERRKEKQKELEMSDKVYLDVLKILHADKGCQTLFAISDSADVGRKGVKFIDKKIVDRNLFDTVTVCSSCVSNQEYDKLYSGFYSKKEYIIAEDSNNVKKN